MEMVLYADPHENIKTILSAFAEHDDPRTIFVSGDRLARISVDGDGRASIEVLNDHSLRAELHQRLCPMRLTSKEGAKPCEINQSLAREILAMLPSRLRNYFPVIRGLVTSPVFRSDGAILDTPGYDEASGLYYHGSASLVLPEIPDEPSREDAASAVGVLRDLVQDLPYADGASAANNIALCLTPLVRTFVGGCVPMFAIDAPDAGSGKSLNARVVSIIHTGGEPRFTELARDSEEMGKRIASLLFTGASVINIDNIDISLKHASLAAMLTAEEYEARLLGRNDRTIRVRNNATFIATGNNITLGGDMRRRIVLIRLDPKQARPWERTGFAYPDLIGHTREHRGELLAALFTMVRAWIVAGKPRAASERPFGSFDQWNRVVSGVLAYAGVEGFLANRDEVLSTIDEDALEWAEFVDALHARFESGAFTAKLVAAEVEALTGELRDSLPAGLSSKVGSSGFARSIGWEFKKRAGQVTPDGLRLERYRDARKGTEWRIVAVNPAGGAA